MSGHDLFPGAGIESELILIDHLASRAGRGRSRALTGVVGSSIASSSLWLDHAPIRERVNTTTRTWSWQTACLASSLLLGTLSSQTARAETASDRARVELRIIDARSGSPLAGARVKDDQGRVLGTSGLGGGLQIQLPTGLDGPLQIERNGYRSLPLLHTQLRRTNLVTLQPGPEKPIVIAQNPESASHDKADTHASDHAAGHDGKAHEPAAKTENHDGKAHEPAAKAEHHDDKTHEPAAKAEHHDDKTHEPAAKADHHDDKDHGHAAKADHHDDKDHGHAAKADHHGDKAHGHAAKADHHGDKAHGHAAKADHHGDKAHGHAAKADHHGDKAHGHAAKADHHGDKAHGHAAKADHHGDKAHGHAAKADHHGDKAHGHAAKADHHGDKAHGHAAKADHHGDKAHEAGAPIAPPVEVPAAEEGTVTPASVTEEVATEAVVEASVPDAPTEKPESSGTYRVRRGDSLWSIATRELGSGYRWRSIFALNQDQLANPKLIQPGMSLMMPRAGAARTIKVRPGDSLWLLAERHMGSGLKWRSLYQMNRGKIANPGVIRIGTRLTLP